MEFPRRFVPHCLGVRSSVAIGGALALLTVGNWGCETVTPVRVAADIDTPDIDELDPLADTDPSATDNDTEMGDEAPADQEVADPSDRPSDGDPGDCIVCLSGRCAPLLEFQAPLATVLSCPCTEGETRCLDGEFPTRFRCAAVGGLGNWFMDGDCRDDGDRPDDSPDIPDRPDAADEIVLELEPACEPQSWGLPCPCTPGALECTIGAFNRVWRCGDDGLRWMMVEECPPDDCEVCRNPPDRDAPDLPQDSENGEDRPDTGDTGENEILCGAVDCLSAGGASSCPSGFICMPDGCCHSRPTDACGAFRRAWDEALRSSVACATAYDCGLAHGACDLGACHVAAPISIAERLNALSRAYVAANCDPGVCGACAPPPVAVYACRAGRCEAAPPCDAECVGDCACIRDARACEGRYCTEGEIAMCRPPTVDPGRRGCRTDGECRSSERCLNLHCWAPEDYERAFGATCPEIRVDIQLISGGGAVWLPAIRSEGGRVIQQLNDWFVYRGHAELGFAPAEAWPHAPVPFMPRIGPVFPWDGHPLSVVVVKHRGPVPAARTHPMVPFHPVNEQGLIPIFLEGHTGMIFSVRLTLTLALPDGLGCGYGGSATYELREGSNWVEPPGLRPWCD